MSIFEKDREKFDFTKRANFDGENFCTVELAHNFFIQMFFCHLDSKKTTNSAFESIFDHLTELLDF